MLDAIKASLTEIISMRKDQGFSTLEVIVSPSVITNMGIDSMSVTMKLNDMKPVDTYVSTVAVIKSKFSDGYVVMVKYAGLTGTVKYMEIY